MKPEELIAQLRQNNAELQGEIATLKHSERALKKREVTLTERNKMLAKVQRNAGIGIWQWHPSTDRMHWTQMMYDIHKIEPVKHPDTLEGFAGSMLRTESRDLFHPDDLQPYAMHVRGVLSGHEPKPWQYRIRRQSGEVRTLHTEIHKELDTDGNIAYLYGYLQDITDRFAAADALQHSYDMLAKVQKSAGMGIWKFELETELFFWSKTMCEMHHYCPPCKEGLPSGFVCATDPTVPANFIHPDDVRRYMDQLGAGIENRRISPIDYRIIRGDGALRTLHCDGDIEFDAEGEISYLFGYVQDITDRVIAEQAIRAQQAAELARE